MRIMKRVFALCLIVSMLAGAVGVVTVSAASGTVKYSDDSVQAAFAKGMGLIADYEADKTVTVAELAAAVTTMSGTTDIAGIYFDKTRYESEASLAEAVAVFVDIAGYGKYAELKFGSKTADALFTTANTMGLMSGVSRDRDAKLTQADLASLAYNLLEVKVLDYTYSSDGSLSFTQTDTLYMSDVLNIYSFIGIVDSAAYSSIISAEGTGGDTVIIDGLSYIGKKGEYEDLVGHRVKAFVRNTDNGNEIITLFDKSTTVEVEAEDINVNSTGKYNIAYYNANDRSIDLKLDARVNVMYNYGLDLEYTAEDFKINQGRLVLIDNDNDGTYEVVKIEEYDSFKIQSVSFSTHKLIDNFGNVKDCTVLCENDYPIYDEGKLNDFNNIPPGKVATVFTNRNGDIVRLYTTLNQTALKIGEIKASKNEIKADGKVYRYVESIEELIEKQKTGDMIRVWLDIYGNIAAFSVSEDAYLYGYMVSFNEGDGMENPKVKMFTEDNQMVVFDTRDTINLNGKKVSAAKAFSKDNTDAGFWDVLGKINQIVKYKANSKNEITAIMTSTRFDTGETERPLKVLDGSYRYFSGPAIIGGKVRVSEFTKVFFVPETLSNTYRYRYGYRNNMLSNDTLYNCQVYDVDEDYYAGTIVCRVSDTGKANVDQIAATVWVVGEVGKKVNDMGEISTYVNCYNTDDTLTEVRFNTDELDANFQDNVMTVDGLGIGDVFQMAMDYNDAREASNIVVRYLNGKTTPYEKASAHWYAYIEKNNFCSDGYTYCAGVVKRFIKDGLVINNQPEGTDDIDDWDRILTIGEKKVPVYVCDNDKGTVTLGSTADLNVGDEIFTLLSNGSPVKLVVYKN